jgi:hypothetical protein
MIVVAWGDFTEASVSCQGFVKLIERSAATSLMFSQNVFLTPSMPVNRSK